MLTPDYREGQINRSPVTPDTGKTRRQLIKDFLFPPKVVESSSITPTTQQVPDNNEPTSILTEKTRALYERESLSNFQTSLSIIAAAAGIAGAAVLRPKERPQQDIQLSSFQLPELERNAMPVYEDGRTRTIFESSGVSSRSNEVQGRRHPRRSFSPNNNSENQRIGGQRHSGTIYEHSDTRRVRDSVYAEQGTMPPPEISYEDIDGMTFEEIKKAMESRKNNPQQQ